MTVFLASIQRWFAIAFPWVCLPCPFVPLLVREGTNSSHHEKVDMEDFGPAAQVGSESPLEKRRSDHLPVLLPYGLNHTGVASQDLREPFIHDENLYNASSRKLLRGACNSSTAEKKILKVRKGVGERVLPLRKRLSSRGKSIQVEGPPPRKRDSA